MDASERVEMKRTLAVDQVERADEQERNQGTSLVADVISSVLLFGLVIGITALVVLPFALLLGAVF